MLHRKRDKWHHTSYKDARLLKVDIGDFTLDIPVSLRKGVDHV